MNIIQVLRLQNGVLQDSDLYTKPEQAEQAFLQSCAKVYGEPIPDTDIALDEGMFEHNEHTIFLHWPNTNTMEKHENN